MQVWNLSYVLSRAKDADGRSLLARDLCAGPSVASEAAYVLVPAAADPAVNEEAGISSYSDTHGAVISGFLHPSSLLLHRFWREACSSLESQVIYSSFLPFDCGQRHHRPFFQLAELVNSDSSTFVRGTLIDSYPRIHYLMLDVCARAGKSASLRATGEGQVSMTLRGGNAGAELSINTLLFQVGC